MKYANEEIKQRFSNEVLSDKNWKEYTDGIVSNSLNYADKEIKKSFSNTVLEDKDWGKIRQEIINNCLKYADEKIKRNFSTKVLNDENWGKHPQAIICNCLNYADKEIKRSFSNTVLNDKNWEKHPQEIISNCLNYADEDIKRSFSNAVLNDKNWKNIDYQITCNCLKISRNKEFALSILINRKKYSWNLIYNSLLCFEKESDFPFEVNAIIKEILENYHNSKIVFKGKHFHYANLFRIDLKNHILWEKEALNIMRNWKKFKRNIVTNVLYSHCDTPNITDDVCKDILINWEVEVNKPILIPYKNKPHYGDNVMIALGHPSLRPQAKKTAISIINSIQAENFKVPEYIKEIAIQIVENDVYPEWKL